MIGFIQGKILEVNSESALAVTNGVGYEVTCSHSTLAILQENLSKEVVLWIHTHVREDALTLFGFIDKTEKQMFLSLLKVNGIGPKMAIHILSGASFDQILVMIESEDVRALSKLPKVGKKTAEQMILTLKGKLVLRDETTKSPLGFMASPRRELTSALLNLGFRSQEVDKVVASIPKDIDLETGLKTALSALTSI